MEVNVPVPASPPSASVKAPPVTVAEIKWPLVKPVLLNLMLVMVAALRSKISEALPDQVCVPLNTRSAPASLRALVDVA